MTLLLFLPLAAIGKNTSMYSLWLLGDASPGVLYITWELFTLDALIVFLAFLCIFLYKKRKAQMHICILDILLIVGYLVDFGFRAYKFSRTMAILEQPATVTPTIWIILPVLAIVFIILAFRGIRKDEILIRMSNRLR